MYPTIVFFVLLQVTNPINLSLDHGPLPSSSFIDNNQPTSRPVVLTTATKQGRSKRKNQPIKNNATFAKKKNPPNKKKDPRSGGALNLN
jgi:hypothetical protein